MAKINLFTSNLTGKQLISEKSETKKAVKAALSDYERANLTLPLMLSQTVIHTKQKQVF